MTNPTPRMSQDRPQRLDPEIAALRAERQAAGTPPLYTLTVEEARRADLAAIQANAGIVDKVRQVEDFSVRTRAATLPARIYHPAPGERRPALVYLYGGGWVLGNLETGDAICRSLANRSGCAIMAVGYRTAPEHRFPAAVDDTVAAVRWVSGHGGDLGLDTTRLAIGGDSAGGNLAAVAAQLIGIQEPGLLSFQVLVYPVTDYRSDTSSRRESDDPYWFNSQSVDWYWGHYLGNPKFGDDPRASPLRARRLKGIPPTLVITAEFDPLRDEGEQYGQRLVEAGVAVTMHRYVGLVHGFFAMPGRLSAARRAHDEVAAALRFWLRPTHD